MTELVRTPRRAAAGLAAALLWALVVAAVSIALAPLGTGALYVVGGAIVVGVIGYVLRRDLRGPVSAGARRILPAEGATDQEGSGRSTVTGHRTGPESVSADGSRPRLRTGVPLAVTGVGSAALAWAIAQQGMKGVIALLAIVVLAGLLALFWPLVVDLISGPAGEPVRRARTAVRQAYRRPVPARPRSRSGEALGVLVAGVAGASIAWVAASLGKTGLIAVVGGIVAAGLFRFVRDRSVFFTFAAVCSLTFVMHKSFGPQDLQLSGGAISVYVTTFDVMLMLLYAFWIREGTFRADIRVAMKEPVIWFPLVGALLLLPSLLAAPTPLLSMAELFRMAWMYLLYVYIAVRVRTRRQVWAILSALVVFVAVELVVVVLQWRTGGVLGLSFLGVPTALGDRVTDSAVLGRPFGTLIHPVFLAAALGTVGMVALAFAVELKRSLARLTAIGVVIACLACMWISDTRASVVAAAMVGVVVVGTGIARRHITWSALGRIGLGLVALGLVFYPQVSGKFANSFRTGHFLTEVESRLELNDIAGRMIGDHLVLGVGLNNFEVVLPKYEANPVIFFGNPVHNLYLLILSETGVIGFLGLLVVGVGLYDVAIRLARSRDRLFGTLGIGIAAAMAFLMVEELLGFSLRQDIPLALYWLLAGLAVAGARMSKMTWPALRLDAARVQRAKASVAPTRHDGARLVVRRLAVAVIAATGLIAAPSANAGLLIALAASPAVATQAVSPTLVFSATERATGLQGIYTANADGSGVQRITSADGRFYSWPRWAFGNTRIVYTVRSGPPGSPEAIAIMEPDGSNPQTLGAFDFRVAQPIIDPSGRSVVFTAAAPWFPKVAVFRMDLATAESTNLTAQTTTLGGFDSDPILTPSADGIVFVWAEGSSGASIAEMNPDGTNRRRITDDAWFNTDPAVSPDGSQIAIASYRGSGTPAVDDAGDISTVKPGDWHVVVRPRSGGSETAITQGADCTTRSPNNPCSATEMSGFLPRFTPDGKSVSFTGALDSEHTCICSVGLDGSDPHTIISRSDLAIDWYDWPQAAGAETSTSHIGTDLHASELLIVTARPDGTRYLMSASADLMHRTEIPLPDGLQPLEARWGPGRSTIIFTAEVAVGPAGAPHPAAPAGTDRRAHVTLDDLNPVTLSLREERVASQAPNLAERQVFLRSPDATVRQITDPWIEDWRDGLGAGDARANTNPVITPDGRYVIVTNTSTTTGESFLLRIDLETGSVLNLTNGSAGALPTDDAEPSVSPDGSRIAFSWTQGELRGIYVMDTETGTHVSAMSSSDVATSMPAWAPDGRSLAYISGRSAGSTVVRAPLSAALTTGDETVVSAGRAPAWRPVVAPEGDRLVFLAAAGNVLGLYGASMSGPAAPRLVQADPLHNVFDVDWR
jgi:Tol biopolymer transport system component/O-antigen ligase